MSLLVGDRDPSEETESVSSDGVAPASSAAPTFPRVPIDVEQRFASIFTVAEHVRTVAEKLDIDSFRSVAEILIPCLDTILRDYKHLPRSIRTAQDFGVAFSGTIFFGRMFARHVMRVTTRLTCTRLVDAVELALQSLDMTMASLKTLFNLVDRLVVESKPLPNVPDSPPIHDPSLSIAERTPVTVAASVDTVSEDQPSDNATNGSLNPGPSAPVPPVTEPNNLKRLVSRAGRNKPLTMWSNSASSKSLKTLASSSPRLGGFFTNHFSTNSANLDIDVSRANVPPNTEQSTAAGSPDSSTPPGESPRSTEELYFSSSGGLCAASLVGLVRILTSMVAVTDPGFTQFFCLSFRFFTTSLDVFNIMKAQYDEKPPADIDPEDLALWEDEAVVAKVRVAKVLLVWLRLHWRYEWDRDVLAPLYQFATSRPVNDPAAMTWRKIIDQLKLAGVGVGYRGCRIQRAILKTNTTPPPSGFSIPLESVLKDAIDRGAFDEVDVLHFHSPNGREQLARQLCHAGSELFRQIDPEDAVRYWKDGRNKAVGDKIKLLVSFENALAYWVARVTIGKPTARSRAEVMEFFIDVASVS